MSTAPDAGLERTPDPIVNRRNVEFTGPVRLAAPGMRLGIGDPPPADPQPAR